MEVLWSSICVLLVMFFVFYLPALVIFLARYFHENFINKKKIYAYVFYFLFGYAILSLIGVGIYFYFSNIDSSTTIRTDIIYIFSASATLSAPILLLLTINIWRDQVKFNEELKVIKDIFKISRDLRNLINGLRRNYGNGQLCIDFFDFLENKSSRKSNLADLISYDFSSFYCLVQELDYKVKELILISSNFDEQQFFENSNGCLVKQIEEFIDHLESRYDYLKNNTSEIEIDSSELIRSQIIEDLFLISVNFFKARQDDLMKYIILHRNDLEIYFLLFELDQKVAEYRNKFEK